VGHPWGGTVITQAGDDPRVGALAQRGSYSVYGNPASAVAATGPVRPSAL
jgi:hypothetical protein